MTPMEEALQKAISFSAQIGLAAEMLQLIDRAEDLEAITRDRKLSIHQRSEALRESRDINSSFQLFGAALEIQGISA
tara:strand:- start:1106 stop:1336 length:231 start_codon:yes stop_codon:yes gene_type:complete